MADWLPQTGRFLQLTTPLGPDVLALTDFTGTEGISQQFHFTLSMFSGETNITADKIVGKDVTVQINVNPESPRYFHGIVNRFYAGKIQEGRRYYYAEIMPWFNSLSHTSDCRVFQNLTAIDIAKKLFGESGIQDFISLLKNSYTARDYCVQYRETTLNFINRILQEEGIFYFFRHEMNKHTLVFADSVTAFNNCQEPVVFDSGSGKGHGLIRANWQKISALYAGKYEHVDYDYQKPEQSLHTRQTSAAKLEAARQFTNFDYPGGYTTTVKGKLLAEHHFEANELANEIFKCGGNYADFAPGNKFTFADESPEADDQLSYALLSVTHYVSDYSYLGTSGSNQSQQYFNLFYCVSINSKIRPLRNYAKPVIYGAQTAVVVGPEGEEIYTDNLGRIKIQFHWDRRGKKNEQSSCWVRVAQSWAGKNWGTLFIPRIGQEVVVNFINGDPDQPIVNGAVYNGINQPHQQLPFEQTQTGIKTQSTKGGSTANANILMFEDKVGIEQILLAAEKDLNQVIKNDWIVNVANQGVFIAKNLILLAVGGNSIRIDNTGVYINGNLVEMNS